MQRALALTGLAAALTLVSLPAAADLAFNASLTSDYRYRGISQTRLKPALQGGVDYSAGAFYLGAWGSTIKWIKDAGGDASAEFDLYGGYKTEIASGLTLDVGVLQYLYPSNRLNPSANTFEGYGALSFGPATFKVSRSFSNLFGFADSKGSMYYDLSASFDLGDGWSLAPHIGRQTVKNSGQRVLHRLRADAQQGHRCADPERRPGRRQHQRLFRPRRQGPRRQPRRGLGQVHLLRRLP
jgi:uncharacterized protein (TIGR02001 family)